MIPDIRESQYNVGSEVIQAYRSNDKLLPSSGIAPLIRIEAINVPAGIAVPLRVNRLGLSVRPVFVFWHTTVTGDNKTLKIDLKEDTTSGVILHTISSNAGYYAFSPMVLSGDFLVVLTPTSYTSYIELYVEPVHIISKISASELS